MVVNPPSSTTSPWVSWRTPKPAARLRLFCLPYAGGAGTIYHRWQGQLPASIDVCPIELPGRLGRHRETPFRAVRPLVAALFDALDGWFDGPVAFFGYSMGALLAHECARELRRRHGREAEHLVVAARWAPHAVDRYRSTRRLTDGEFVAEMSRRYGDRLRAMADDPEMLALMVRILRADLALLEDYAYEEEPPLAAPITVLGGERDLVVSPALLGGWSTCTRGSFATRVFPGGHFFLHEDEPAVVSAVSSILACPGGPG